MMRDLIASVMLARRLDQGPQDSLETDGHRGEHLTEDVLPLALADHDSQQVEQAHIAMVDVLDPQRLGQVPPEGVACGAPVRAGAGDADCLKIDPTTTDKQGQGRAPINMGLWPRPRPAVALGDGDGDVEVVALLGAPDQVPHDGLRALPVRDFPEAADFPTQVREAGAQTQEAACGDRCEWQATLGKRDALLVFGALVAVAAFDEQVATEGLLECPLP